MKPLAVMGQVVLIRLKTVRQVLSCGKLMRFWFRRRLLTFIVILKVLFLFLTLVSISVVLKKFIVVRLIMVLGTVCRSRCRTFLPSKFKSVRLVLRERSHPRVMSVRRVASLIRCRIVKFLLFIVLMISLIIRLSRVPLTRGARLFVPG